MRYARKREYHQIKIYEKPDHIVITDGERRIILKTPTKITNLEQYLPIQYIKPQKIDLKTLSISIARKLQYTSFKKIKVIIKKEMDKSNFGGKLGEEIAIRELFKRNKVKELIYHKVRKFYHQYLDPKIIIERGGKAGLDIIDDNNKIVYEIKALNIVSASEKGLESSIKRQINYALKEANIWLLTNKDFIDKIVNKKYKFRIILVLYKKARSSSLEYEYALVEINTVYNGYEIYIPDSSSGLYKYFYGSIPLYTIISGINNPNPRRHSKNTTITIYVGDRKGKPYVIKTDIKENENDN